MGIRIDTTPIPHTDAEPHLEPHAVCPLKRPRRHRGEDRRVRFRLDAVVSADAYETPAGDEPEQRARLVARRLLRRGLQRSAPMGPAQLVLSTAGADGYPGRSVAFTRKRKLACRVRPVSPRSYV
jgi:hypothetical protein